MEFTIEEYMKKNNIKSKKTVYNKISKGQLEKNIKENGDVFVREITPSVNCNVSVNDTLQLQNELQKLQNENKLLKLQLDNKDKFISHLEEQIRQQYNQIQGLNYQISELNKSQILLLENKKERKKFLGIF